MTAITSLAAIATFSVSKENVENAINYILSPDELSYMGEHEIDGIRFHRFSVENYCEVHAHMSNLSEADKIAFEKNLDDYECYCYLS